TTASGAAGAGHRRRSRACGRSCWGTRARCRRARARRSDRCPLHSLSCGARPPAWRRQAACTRPARARHRRADTRRDSTTDRLRVMLRTPVSVLRTLVNSSRALLTGAREVARFREISTVFVMHGFGWAWAQLKLRRELQVDLQGADLTKATLASPDTGKRLV